MNQFEQIGFDHVNITFSENELRYLKNDLIAYILEIKHKVLGKEAVDYSIDNDNILLTDEKKKILEDRGFYDRIALLRRLEKIESECFPDITTPM